MKKVLMIALIIGFVWAGPALADEFISGTCDILFLQIYESIPCDFGQCGESVRACDVGFRFITRNNQEYFLTGTAYGTALNLGILKAGNFGELISCELKYEFVRDFAIEFKNIDFVFAGVGSPE